MSSASGKTSSMGMSSGTMTPDEAEESVQLVRAIELEERTKAVQFKWTSDIGQLYSIGDDVIPSENGRSSVKAVVFAKRLSDGKKVIIKQRNKTRSFKDEQEVTDWVFNMKLLHYVTMGGKNDSPKSNGKRKDDVLDKIRDCSHIARVFDIIEDAKYYYVVMEYVIGRDLFEYFIQEKPYERSYALDIAKQLAKSLCFALDKLHTMGIVHRDVKLENIVLDEEKYKQEGAELRCVTKIIDFDTCELFRPGNKAFHVLGTDQYIAPETYAGYAGPASDMWAVGVIMYILLTGSFPFHYALFDDQPGENYVGHPRMDQIRRRLRIAKIDWSNKVWSQGPKAKDFVRRCFVTDQRRRITVRDALEHSWLASEKKK